MGRIKNNISSKKEVSKQLFSNKKNGVLNKLSLALSVAIVQKQVLKMLLAVPSFI